MKIIYLSSSFIPSKSANSVHVMKMSNAFSNLGHEVTLLARENNTAKNGCVDIFNHYGVTSNFSIERIYCPQIKFSWIWYDWNCWRYIRKNRPDLVYSREPFGAYLSSRHKFSTIYECHSPPLGRRDKILLPRLFNIRKINKIVVISNALKKILIASIPSLDKKKIEVFHDGVDLDKFVFPVNNKKAKKSLGFLGNGLIIGYAGSLYKGRGIELILELANKLKQHKFIIMGGHNNEIKNYKILSEKKEIKNLIFLGFIPNNKLVDHLNACDILLMPYQKQLYSAGGKKRDSSNWMSPMKMFEYMASGTPIVSSDFLVLREILVNEENSLLVKPDNVHEWINAINRIGNNIELGRKLGRNAREKVESYSWAKRAMNILDF